MNPIDFDDEDLEEVTREISDKVKKFVGQHLGKEISLIKDLVLAENFYPFKLIQHRITMENSEFLLVLHFERNKEIFNIITKLT